MTNLLVMKVSFMIRPISTQDSSLRSEWHT